MNITTLRRDALVLSEPCCSAILKQPVLLPLQSLAPHGIKLDLTNIRFKIQPKFPLKIKGENVTVRNGRPTYRFRRFNDALIHHSS